MTTATHLLAADTSTHFLDSSSRWDGGGGWSGLGNLSPAKVMQNGYLASLTMFQAGQILSLHKT